MVLRAATTSPNPGRGNTDGFDPSPHDYRGGTGRRPDGRVRKKTETANQILDDWLSCQNDRRLPTPYQIGIALKSESACPRQSVVARGCDPNWNCRIGCPYTRGICIRCRCSSSARSSNLRVRQRATL